MSSPADLAAGMTAVLEAQRALFVAWAGLARTFMGPSITINFPFGQGFTLYANPSTNWWGQLATADPDTERRIVTNVASYGKQIGWMMDMLIDLAEGSEKVSQADLEELKQMRAAIDRAKR